MTTSTESKTPRRRPEGYDEARATMIRLAHGFTARPPTDRKEAWAAFDRFVLDLAEKGWKRGDIYHLLADVEDNEAESLSEESRDALYDYETGLVGHVSHDCIVRLPGEPSDQEEFLKYVYGEKWMNE